MTVDYRDIVALQPAAQRVGALKDWQFQFVVDSFSNPVSFMSSPLFLEPSFQSKIPKRARHKQWVKLDVSLLQSNSAQLGSLDKSQLAALVPGTASPLAAFDGLSTRGARPGGREQLSGMQTRRYRMSGDLTQTGALGSVVAKFAQMAGHEWPVEVWIDDSSLIRRVRFTSAPIPALGMSTLVITADVSQLRADTRVNIPPATNVTDIRALGR